MPKRNLNSLAHALKTAATCDLVETLLKEFNQHRAIHSAALSTGAAPVRTYHTTRRCWAKKEVEENEEEEDFIDGLYAKWIANPSQVDATWDAYFSEKTRASSTSSSSLSKVNLPVVSKQVVPTVAGQTRPISTTQQTQAAAAAAAAAGDWKNIDDHLTVAAIIRAYQTRGHLAADLDPLGIVTHPAVTTQDGVKRIATEAVLRQHYSYIFGQNSLDTIFRLPSSTVIGGDQTTLPLREILDRLERVYCGKIGLEYMQITSLDKTNWIRERFELPGVMNFSADEKRQIYNRLVYSTIFENFLAKKFPSEKRFGLEGCDIMIPVIDEIIERSALLGVDSVMIGMAHRGRLNVLANICRKSISDIMTQFHVLHSSDPGSGDVKYHLGTFSKRMNRRTRKNMRITVVANPSHLEYVNPVLTGKVRAEMFYRADRKGKKVLPIIIHGDASFCGQGVVYETIHLSSLPEYNVKGTIHIVSNNQIGFTTDPRYSRSSRYCTDVARVLNAPILHVNADDAEGNIHCARVAADWRAKFHKDIVIDIVGYRRNGHNEADEPMFTQPLMYQRIKAHKPILSQYTDQLIKENVIKQEDAKKWQIDYMKMCEEGFNHSKTKKAIKYGDWLDSPWTGFFEGRDLFRMCPTGVHVKTLTRIGKAFSTPPPKEHNFELHKGILRILGQRAEMVKAQVADWALGEAFAIGSLVKDGVHVRLSGQDVERGTFSHRHHIYHHQKKDKTRYNCFDHLYPDQAQYTVTNSSLSECAILGFEHGYSMANPHAVVIWESQFGDFCNTAQCIIDQFISSGEAKWVRQSGMVLLLPHGLEGMGPEHSSGRMERFLQLSNDDPEVFPDICDPDFLAKQLYCINWFVTNVSTPANLFHVLRRQVAIQFRKPLINFSPKSVLRNPAARSPFRDFDECSSFQRIIPEKGVASKCPEHVKKLIFCSGKVYYDLLKERDSHEQDETVALVRVEQICPFPYDLISKEICNYPKAELIWAQEEHKNQGAWPYVQPRFDTTLIKLEAENRCFKYFGRPPSSAPSTGNKARHLEEYAAFIESIFGKLTEANKLRLECLAKEAQEKARAAKAAAAEKKKAALAKAAADKKAAATAACLARVEADATAPNPSAGPAAGAAKKAQDPAKK